ncbi:MAG: LacI family transcriptional regulator [Clostridia bacterium]|nr:LacI family transcriptional regulator [Clostridia bacterium]
MVTIYDIAKKSGYSPTTISKALNDYPDISTATKAKIRAMAREMGYTPNSSARALATSKSWLIGVLYNEDLGLGIRHPHFSEIIESFKKQVEESGYELIFIGSKIGTQHTSCSQHCRYRGVDAVFIANGLYEEAALEELIDSGIPCIASELVSSKIINVLSDNVNGAKKAVDYLISLGHTNIAHIAAPTTSTAGEERVLGYKLSLEAHGMEFRQELMPNADLYNFKSGYEAMKKLLSLKTPPTAVFAAFDTIACGAISAAREAGLSIPQDLSVIGFDDIEIASHIVPGLTTIRQDRSTIGVTCAEMVLRLLNNETMRPTIIRVPTKLVIRNSCKRLSRQSNM